MSSTTGPRRSSRQSTPTAQEPPLRKTDSAIRKSRGQSPAPLSSRPNLPKNGNSLMLNFGGKLHKVKIQTLNLGNKSDNNTITIARVKCPVPKGVPGHIIKRFDTDSVSASSLFRAAFPLATDVEEVTEMNWIAKGSRGRYGDTKKAGVEHDETRKLSGTWIPADKAVALAEEYNVIKFAADLIAFTEPVAGDVSAAVPDSEADSPAAPRTKRQRVASPSALSGASANGVTIHQTLSTDLETKIQIETTSVEIETPASLLLPSNEMVTAQIEEAKLLVEVLKQSGTLADLTKSTEIISSGNDSKKRGHENVEEDDEDDEDEVEVDTRGFFGKIFKKAPRVTKRVPKNAGRETVGLTGSQIAVLEKKAVTPEGRRWIAGLGLAVAVGATAAAPYLFG